MTAALAHGRACMSDDELDLLARTVSGPGDHLEIGSMWGGTAIAAAAAKEQAGQPGTVVCIDPFVDNDAGIGGRPNPDIFWENIDHAGFRDRVELHVCLSAPWPLPTTRRFASVLIDGDHKAPWPETDWESARCVTDLILVHDVNRHEPAVARLHERVEADPDWRIRDSAKFLYAYELVAA